jgi:hypothetical protein
MPFRITSLLSLLSTKFNILQCQRRETSLCYFLCSSVCKLPLFMHNSVSSVSIVSRLRAGWPGFHSREGQ